MDGQDGKHAEITGGIFFSHVGAGKQLAVAFGQHDAAARSRQAGGNVVAAGTATREKIGFGGPTGAAGITAIGGFDQGHDGGGVGGGGGAEQEGGSGRVHNAHMLTP